MATRTTESERTPFLPEAASRFLRRRAVEMGGATLGVLAALIAIALASHDSADPSFNTATTGGTANLIGRPGAYVADLLLQGFGLGAAVVVLLLLAWAWAFISHRGLSLLWLRLSVAPIVLVLFAIGLAAAGGNMAWPITAGLGGAGGAVVAEQLGSLLGGSSGVRAGIAAVALVLGVAGLVVTIGLTWQEWAGLFRFSGRSAAFAGRGGLASGRWIARRTQPRFADEPDNLDAEEAGAKHTGAVADDENADETSSRRSRLRLWHRSKTEAEPIDRAEPSLYEAPDTTPAEPAPPPRPTRAKAKKKSGGIVAEPAKPAKPGKRAAREGQGTLDLADGMEYELPALALLAEPDPGRAARALSEDALEQNAKLLLSVLEDFGVFGEILRVHPGPVVTLYEFVPQAGTRTSRVIGLADDIARSMSAISVRVATIPGRNVIGIELPNAEREGVLLRELLGSDAYESTAAKLTLALGKTISGEPVIADLARMPHLLVAGTTGSGKSVAINSMILSLLYRLPPEQCRLILIDPKMLELSVYDDIPHLLTPVVTEPGKAVVALKWVVREMENRYQGMSKLGVRNITGYNKRLEEARAKGETLTRRVQVGLDSETGEPLYEEQELDLSPMPYIVVVVDEMADLMLVAGKDIEGAVQRLAQMARAAGIHLIMATQRPSVDVITGTIKANFPTRISFQVTSKIDSRTILGEAGAEQLLGQGDMLFLEGGGRLTRVHGPLVTDAEVERVTDILRTQARPDYRAEVVADEETSGGSLADAASDDPLYDQAVALVARERKASTSFVQRHLQIGYNRAARIIERMEAEGVVSQANHVGKREVLVSDHSGDA